MIERNGIRPAEVADHLAIQGLLRELGYPDTGAFLEKRLEVMLADPDEVILVYVDGGRIEAFIELQFSRKLGVEGDFARIAYFSVSERARGKGIGAELEDYVTELARARNCDRMEVHCHARRTDAHRFYHRQGYEESPKYFIKKLNHNS